MKTIKAYCDRTGQIEFGPSVPKGSFLIVSGPESTVREAIAGLARMSYPSKRGGTDQVPLVPGIPEAKDDGNRAVDALIKFSKAAEEYIYGRAQ